jgi:hypothetical protein
MNIKNHKMIALPSSVRKAGRVRLFIVFFGLLFLARVSFAGVQTQIGHNTGDSESPSFTFTNVPPPARNDAATAAKFTIVTGDADANGGGVDALHDGKVPTEADAPADNFFFAAGTAGGRVQVDLGRVIELTQVNTYSWHPSTRGPQVYKLYASDGTAGDFVAQPGKDADLEKAGWKLIAQVDTRTQGSDNGGQYGVGISDTSGVIGKYQYLLFDIAPTETDDEFGNTFYSEIDVVAKNASVEPIAPAASAPIIVHSTDGYCEITIDTAKAPELRSWAEQKLAPTLAEWYPKIVAMMPSDGFSAPKNFSVVLRPMNGVAYTTGTRIVGNSTWLGTELNHEAVGSLIHETVHIVQQYGHGWRDDQPVPGWLTEGIPDYIRFFKYEPQTLDSSRYGAGIPYMKHMRNINYDGMYRISANFLDYVIRHYDPKQTLLQKVNAACRQGTYTDGLWKEMTGKTLFELNDEWKAAVQQQIANQTEPGSTAPADTKKVEGANKS